jgi:hypothetical protein
MSSLFCSLVLCLTDMGFGFENKNAFSGEFPLMSLKIFPYCKKEKKKKKKLDN